MLVPREHGAYGQLLFPTVCALLIGRPAAGAYLLGAAGVSAFLAHESVLVVTGQRGGRAARERSREAWRSLVLFGGVALVSGTIALLLLPRSSIIATAGTVVLTLVVAGVVAAGRERSTAGEVIVGITLASLSIPVALAGRVSATDAATVAGVFASAFTIATVAVRSMIGRVSRAGGPPPIIAGVLPVAVIATLAVLALRGRLTRAAPVAVVPMCLVALWLTVWPPPPKRLRAVGWTLVGATALTAIVLVTALT